LAHEVGQSARRVDALADVGVAIVGGRMPMAVEQEAGEIGE
jgi:hypothetical protein